MSTDYEALGYTRTLVQGSELTEGDILPSFYLDRDARVTKTKRRFDHVMVTVEPVNRNDFMPSYRNYKSNRGVSVFRKVV